VFLLLLATGRYSIEGCKLRANHGGCDGINASTERAGVPMAWTRIKRHLKDINELFPISE
jgi:hypothetical protein